MDVLDLAELAPFIRSPDDDYVATATELGVHPDAKEAEKLIEVDVHDVSDATCTSILFLPLFSLNLLRWHCWNMERIVREWIEPQETEKIQERNRQHLHLYVERCNVRVHLFKKSMG